MSTNVCTHFADYLSSRKQISLIMKTQICLLSSLYLVVVMGLVCFFLKIDQLLNSRYITNTSLS